MFITIPLCDTSHVTININDIYKISSPKTNHSVAGLSTESDTCKVKIHRGNMFESFATPLSFTDVNRLIQEAMKKSI